MTGVDFGDFPGPGSSEAQPRRAIVRSRERRTGSLEKRRGGLASMYFGWMFPVLVYDKRNV
jgi:hypothetical protein